MKKNSINIKQKRTDALLGVEKLEERTKGFSSVYENHEKLMKIIKNSLNLSQEVEHPQIPGLKIAQSTEDIIKSFFLRSIVFEDAEYDEEFPIGKTGLEFDLYDSNSITVLQEKNDTLVSSFRYVMDSDKGFPLEAYCSKVEPLRKYGKLAEVSRTVVMPEFQRNPTILLDDLIHVYKFAIANDIARIIYEAPPEVVKMYNKTLGHQNCLEENVTCDKITKPFMLMSWNIWEDVSPRFLQKIERRTNK